MTRPTLDETLMKMAVVMSRRGTCSRSQVGAVFALHGRVLATGFNGAPAGVPHCDHTCDCGAIELLDGTIEHHEECATGPCVTAVHAEANAIAFAARHGIPLAGSWLYTTLAPCLACAQLIINTGTMGVTSRAEYRDPTGVELLNRQGVYTNYDPVPLTEG